MVLDPEGWSFLIDNLSRHWSLRSSIVVINIMRLILLLLRNVIVDNL